MALPASSLVGLVLLSGSALAQQPGTLQPEVHPPLWLQDCTAAGCQWEKSSVTIDANWRWFNKAGTNCYTNKNDWDPALCSDPKQCAMDCALEGADYASTYGVTSNEHQDGISLRFVTHGTYSNNFGSRLYVMDGEDAYKIWKLKNREFTFDVDVSSLVCGLNGALYFVEMDKHGDFDGAANKAGAKFGTGYCDAQCPHDIKYIKGEVNLLNWNNVHDPPIGHFGSCCAELDIWEANSRATAYTPHPCRNAGSLKCEGVVCGDTDAEQRYDGTCDKDGCDFNNFRMGDTSFYGAGSQFKVDTTKPMTVVTQFITHDGTDTGTLVEIKRFFVQDGKVIENSQATSLGPDGGNSVTDQWCSKQKEAFSDPDDFKAKGGLKAMGEAMERGMVLVLSLWDDTQVNMLWLDSKYPTEKPDNTPGVMRGPCPGGTASTPLHLRQTNPDAQVHFSKIKVGTFGSTYQSGRLLAVQESPLV